MTNGFLDDLPDLNLPGSKAKKKKPRPSQPGHNLEVVLYHKLRCPKCKSDKVSVYVTKRPLRYHKCKKCGHRFKSVEK